MFISMLLMTLSTGLGCAGSTPSSNGPAPEADQVNSEPSPPDRAKEAAPAAHGAIPEGSRFFCHLNCSGTESITYGKTEEEARAAALALVGEKCRPEDGQYFLVCEPLK